MNTPPSSDVKYPKSPAGPRIVAAFAAVLASASLIGSVLGLFDRQSHDAMVAREATSATATVMVDTSNRTRGDITQTSSAKRG